MAPLTILAKPGPALRKFRHKDKEIVVFEKKENADAAFLQRVKSSFGLTANAAPTFWLKLTLSEDLQPFALDGVLDGARTCLQNEAEAAERLGLGAELHNQSKLKDDRPVFVVFVDASAEEAPLLPQGT